MEIDAFIFDFVRYYCDMKRRIIFITIFLLISSSLLQASATDRNVIEVVSVEQITQGPYSVGDIVTFKVNYTDSTNIGADLVIIKGAGTKNFCLSQDSQSFGSPILWNREIDPPADQPIMGIRWQAESSLDTFGRTHAIISSFVVPCRLDNSLALKRVSVNNYKNVHGSISISPEKLNDIASLFNLNIYTNPSDLLNLAEEVGLPKLSDKVTLTNIPKNPRIGRKYLLPRLTQNGVPISWLADSMGACSISYDTFEGDIGGSLLIQKKGTCYLLSSTMPNDKYKSPIYKANIKFKLMNSESTKRIIGVYTVKN
jgi:hypothetical protein